MDIIGYTAAAIVIVGLGLGVMMLAAVVLLTAIKLMLNVWR